MDINFNSVKELYERVYPALKIKVRELKNNGIYYIKEEDIWNCLITLRWKKDKGLLLSDIVDDILNVENSIIDNYVKKQMEKSQRKINLEEQIF